MDRNAFERTLWNMAKYGFLGMTTLMLGSALLLCVGPDIKTEWGVFPRWLLAIVVATYNAPLGLIAGVIFGWFVSQPMPGMKNPNDR